MAQNLRPDRVYRLWESTQDIIEFSRWLPEVVGTERELRRIGSILVAKIPQDEDEDVVVVAVDIEVKEPLRFRDADVSKYRDLLSFFRRNHGRTS